MFKTLTYKTLNDASVFESPHELKLLQEFSELGVLACLSRCLD
jgi:hypothetical protein